MENFEISFFLKAFIFRSKPLVVRFSPLLALLMLALGLPMEGTLLPPKWHALKNGLLKGPAFAFLLLNCLIVTIVASSKLEGEKRGHKEGSKGLDLMGQADEERCEKRGLTVVNVAGELEIHTATQKGYDYPESIRNNKECLNQNISNNYCSEKSGLREEVANRELATGVIEKLEGEKGDVIVEENVTKDGGSRYNETPLKNGYDVHSSRNKGGSYPRRSRSLNAIKPYDYKPTHEQLKKNFVSEKKPIRSRDRLASRRNEKVRLHPNRPLLTSNLEKTQFNLITRDSLVSREAGSHPDQKPALQNSFDTTADKKCVKGLGRAGNFVDHPAPAPAAMAHPSMAEVWAAICMQSNKRDGCTASNLHAEKRSNEEPNSQTAKKPQPAAVTATPTQPIAPAAALAPPAASSRTPPPKAAAAAASSRRAAKAALPKYPVEKPSVAAATEKGRELEELNRRAESFIARFNCQIRLQREESLQRQKRGRRTCNYERSHGLQLPPRGLLVG